MPGKKRKAVIDLKEIAAYRQKLRRPARPPLKLTNRERKKYTVESPFPQKFSIPSNILLYLVRNPSSPSVHLKLISSCKSLLRMSRILPVQHFRHDEGNDADEWNADGVQVQLKNQVFKFWIHDQLFIGFQPLPNLASTLVNHIFKFSLRELRLYVQVLTFEELQILVSGGHLECVDFRRTVIKNSDGSITEFEKVFELICCTELIVVLPDEQHGIGQNTSRKLIEILSSDQLPPESYICLWNIPQNFDFHLFFNFLKVNMTQKQHYFNLDFHHGISDAYKNQLQQYVDEIIQMRVIYAHTVPAIQFPGQIGETRYELWRMRCEEVEGILRKPN